MHPKIHERLWMRDLVLNLLTKTWMPWNHSDSKQILSRCETRRKKTSVSRHETTRNSASECTQCRIIWVSASSWEPLSALISMFAMEHLSVSSSWNPPLTITILSTGAPARSLSNKKRAKSALFLLRATKLDRTSGAVLSRVQQSFEWVGGLENASFLSCTWSTFPCICQMSRLFDGSPFQKPEQLSQIYPWDRWMCCTLKVFLAPLPVLDHLLLASISLRLAWPEVVPYHHSKLPSWPIYFQCEADHWHQRWRGELPLVHGLGSEANLPSYRHRML